MKKIFSKLKSSGLCFAGVSAVNILGSDADSAINIFAKISKMIKGDFLTYIYDLVAQVLYLIGKWMLVLVDFCFTLVRQFCGVNADFSSYESIKENDIVLQFMFSDNVVSIVKSLVIFAVVLIIVLSIIAIIKNEWTALEDNTQSGEIKNSKAGIWKSIFQSLMLLFLVPYVLVCCMVLSSAALESLYRATSGGSNVSLGGQVFMASAYNSNAYRVYATNNMKIPITYSLDSVQDYSAITDVNIDGTMAEVLEALDEYKNSSIWMRKYSTFAMFYTNDFFEMDTIDTLQKAQKENEYNAAYDAGIYTYRYEYYVMADLIDYMMRSGNTIYIMTLQEAYDSCAAVGLKTYITRDSDSYTMTVNYDDGEDAITYTSKAGKYDEADGAVFVACVSDTIISGNTESQYYRPLSTKLDGFDSDYLGSGEQYVVMRGMFQNGAYPTAIRKTDGVVSFYRDSLNIPTFANLFPHISYELPEGSTEVVPGASIIRGTIQYLTAVDISQFVPYVYMDIDFLTLFDKDTKVITSLSNGSFYLDYMFTCSGIDMNFVYSRSSLLSTGGIIILLLAGAILIAKLLKVFVGLLKRVVDLMFLYIMYPAAVATIPLYGRSSFTKWVSKVVNNLLSMYGVVLGFNLILALLPIINTLDIVTPQMMQRSFLKVLPSQFTVPFINAILQLLFLLVGINMIFYVGKIIYVVVFDVSTKDKEKVKSMDEEGEAVLGGVTGLINGAKNVVNGSALMEAVKGIAGYVPGSEIVSDVKKKWHNHQESSQVHQDARDSRRDARTRL